MPDFDDRERKPESQSRKEQARPVCEGVLRPMAYAWSCSQDYCESVTQYTPEQEIKRRDYIEGKKSEKKRSVDRENEALGYSEDFIKAIQCRLNVSLTGKFDPETRRAMMAVQRCFGMTDNGKVTPKLLKKLELDPKKYGIDPTAVTTDELREKLGDSFTPGTSTYIPKASIRLDKEYKPICPENKKEHSEMLGSMDAFLAANASRISKLCAAEGLLPPLGFSICGEYCKSQKHTGQFECSSHQASDQSKTDLIFHPPVGIAPYLPLLEHAAGQNMTEIRSELMAFQKKGSPHQEYLKQALVSYVVESLHEIEQVTEEKADAIKWTQKAEKYSLLKDYPVKPQWLKKRERVSKWLIGLSKIFQDPAYSALALQGTHYAGLDSILSHAETGYPYRVKNVASAIKSGEGGREFAKNGDMYNIYRRGLVCNEFAYTAGQTTGLIEKEDGEREKVFPSSIHQQGWKMGKDLFSLCSLDSLQSRSAGNKTPSCRFSTKFSDIEQGDAIVRLEKSGKIKGNSEYDGVLKYNDYVGKHIDIVVAVTERIKPKRKRKKENKQDESPQKAVLLAGARGTAMPSGIHVENGTMKWYFEDDKKFQSPFVVIKSNRLESSVSIGNLNIENYEYNESYNDVNYTIDRRDASPVKQAIFINTPLANIQESFLEDGGHVNKTEENCIRISSDELEKILARVPKEKRQYFYALIEDEDLLRQFQQELISLPMDNAEMMAFVLEYMNKHEKDVKVKLVNRIERLDVNDKNMSIYFNKDEMVELKALLKNNIGSMRLILDVANLMVIYRAMSSYSRKNVHWLIKNYSTDWPKFSLMKIGLVDEQDTKGLVKSVPMWL